MPEEGHGGLNGSDPPLPFLSPPLRVAVPSFLDKGKVLPVGDQHLSGLEGLHVELLYSELVVPAVGLGILFPSLPR